MKKSELYFISDLITMLKTNARFYQKINFSLNSLFFFFLKKKILELEKEINSKLNED